MEYGQVVRRRFLIPLCKGSNPFTPNFFMLIVQLDRTLDYESKS